MPISILPAVSKVFERKIYAYMSGYRKGYNTQYALMVSLEKWRKSLDNEGYTDAVIMNLCKVRYNKLRTTDGKTTCLWLHQIHPKNDTQLFK